MIVQFVLLYKKAELRHCWSLDDGHIWNKYLKVMTSSGSHVFCTKKTETKWLHKDPQEQHINHSLHQINVGETFNHFNSELKRKGKHA